MTDRHPAVEIGVSIAIAVATVAAIVWLIPDVIVPAALDALGLRWVPITGGYFVVEPGSPVPAMPQWASPIIATVLALGMLVLLVKYMDFDPGDPAPPFVVPFLRERRDDEERGGE